MTPPLLAACLLSICALGRADEFLPADQAFAFTHAAAGKALLWHWEIAPGYSLYRDRIHVKVVEPASVRLVGPVFPPAIIHPDEFFGPQAVYTRELTLKTHLQCTLSRPAAIVMEVRYQGCADAGLCYSPEVRSVPLTVDPSACRG